MEAETFRTTQTQTSKEVGPDAVEELQQHIAREIPSLHQPAPQDLAALARGAIGKRLVLDFDWKVDLAKIGFVENKALFIDIACKTKSRNTRRACSFTLRRLDSFPARRGIAALEMRAKDADDFAYALTAEGRA